MYKLTYNLTVNNLSFVQILFVDTNSVIMQLNDKWSIFLKMKNKNYFIDKDNQKLSLIDNSKFKNQIESISKEFGIIEISESETKEIILGYPSKKYQCRNSQITPCFKSDIKVITIPEFYDTSYLSYIEFEKQNQLIDIPLQSNELIVFNKTELFFPKGIQNQKIELISIEDFSFSKDFLEISNYAIN